jgi:predicted NAD/FAD-dependent oxidoreductase
MAGLACAEHLSNNGHEVVLFDKGRGPGGRMSTRRVDTSAGTAFFDHGAQYFTVRDSAFRARVDAWMNLGLVAPWPAAGADAHVGVPAMNAPIRQMAEGQSVHWATLVSGIENAATGWRLRLKNGAPVDVDIALLATPAEQAASLLAPVAADLAARAAVPSAPCWTLMLAFAEKLRFAPDCLRATDADPIGWAARNNSKPGRTGPEAWVVQAGADWSRQNLEADPFEVVAALSADFVVRLGGDVPSPVACLTHRWRYARAGAEGSVAVWDADRRLGLCGDWLVGPRVEAAFLSGQNLARRILSAP